MSDTLRHIVAANRKGMPIGIPSWCTAHPETLSAIFSAYRDDKAPILVEATCNQVNQFGGYTGMTPAGFRSFVTGLAQRAGIDPARLILGGDHLGPNPWRKEPAETAMAKARDLVAAYVEAGFQKIHLDASMACADDGVLSEATIAERAADLCAVAERAAPGRSLYVIGTEVPIPGGEMAILDHLAATTPAAVAHTFALHQSAFRDAGVAAALERVIGMVVQPGVDFGNDQVFAFAPDKARRLAESVPSLPGFAFEAHSTDYQSAEGLSGLVAAHFPILKVGPELTFAYRQAVFALAHIEMAMAPPEPSRLLETIEAEMLASPGDWRAYVAQGPREAAIRLYGLSDRVRYYWPKSAIQSALAQLRANLTSHPPEPGIVAQYLGTLVDAAVPPDKLMDRAIAANVSAVVTKYRAATGN
jgi:D-tagatose-bisphosphate aldolase class II non-catalytic subunit